MPNRVNAATVGALVRDARTAAGLTQTELGNRIGASRFWVAEFEKGKPSAAIGLALRALHALGLTVRIESKHVSGRRARPPAPEGALAAAAAFGVDLDQLRHSLARTPDERLRELDANMTFLRELQHTTPPKRTRRRP